MCTLLLYSAVKIQITHCEYISSHGHFSQKLKSSNFQYFDVCLDFTLSLLDELKDDRDIYQVLMDKKKFYLRSLQKAKQLERQLQKNNLETLLLKGNG